METRQSKPSLITLRQEMESNVQAFNKYLNEAVKEMNWHQLLCNCHPIERSKFAWRLYKRQLLTRDSLTEYALKKDKRHE